VPAIPALQSGVTTRSRNGYRKEKRGKEKRPRRLVEKTSMSCTSSSVDINHQKSEMRGRERKAIEISTPCRTGFHSMIEGNLSLGVRVRQTGRRKRKHITVREGPFSSSSCVLPIRKGATRPCPNARFRRGSTVYAVRCRVKSNKRRR